VSDGERVYVHFGHMGTAAYTLDGEQVWVTQKYPYKHQHGNGGSPILADGKLIFSCDGIDTQFVLALNTKDGSEAWKTDRKSKAKSRFSFATAQVIESGGRKLVVSPAADFVAAYDLTDGKEVWRANYPKSGWSLICRPVLAGGLVVISTGYETPYLIAVDPNGQGDVTASHIKWEYKKHPPNTPTPLAIGEELYNVSDSGMMSCLDAKTGTVHWEERLKGRGFSSSPVLLNGKIYVTSEDGVGSVVTPNKKELEVEDGGEMKEKTFATFVPGDGALYLRTESKLYKFAAKR
jgi:outer membrane protein assembly factor BamB